MGLKSIIPWLVVGVVCIALIRVGINFYAGAKEDLDKLKRKVKGGPRKTAKKTKVVK